MLSAEEVQKVHRMYKQLSINYNQYSQKKRSEEQKERLALKKELPSGTPRINQKSNKLYKKMV